MVLYNAMYEKFKAVLLYGDDGKYLEERVLLNQMSMIIDLYVLDEYFLAALNNTSDEIDENTINKNMWNWIEKEFDEILPIDSSFNDFKKDFEKFYVNFNPDNRLSRMQQTLIEYFIESLKAKVLDGIITEEEAEKASEEYKKLLITPNSAILNEPEMNLGLDNSIKFYDIKMDEYRNAIPKNNVK